MANPKAPSSIPVEWALISFMCTYIYIYYGRHVGRSNPNKDFCGLVGSKLAYARLTAFGLLASQLLKPVANCKAQLAYALAPGIT